VVAKAGLTVHLIQITLSLIRNGAKTSFERLKKQQQKNRSTVITLDSPKANINK
jgi:hypothetical protein